MHCDSYDSGSFTAQPSPSMMQSAAHSSTPPQSSGCADVSKPQISDASSHTVPHPASAAPRSDTAIHASTDALRVTLHTAPAVALLVDLSLVDLTGREP